MQAKALGITQTASIHNMGMKRLYARIRACHPEIIRTRNKYTQRKDVDVEKCAELLNQGYSLALLSTETGISVTNLRNALADAGVYKIRTPPTSVVKKQMVRAPRSLPYSFRLTVASSQKWQCKRCDEPLSSRFELDHVVPLHRYGTNELSNLEALCADCHNKKTAQEVLEQNVQSAGYVIG